MARELSNVARHTFLILAIPVMVTAWLPLMRGLIDGPSYQWGGTLFGRSFSGSGVAGDYPWLIAQAAIAISVAYLGWRKPGRVAGGVALAWAGLWLADAAYALTTGQEVIFHGDTLGVAVSVTGVSVAYFGVLSALAVIWIAGGRDMRAPRWTPMNAGLLAAALLILAPQHMLLPYAVGREAAEVWGVLLTMAQWLLLALSLAPWSGHRHAAYA